MIFAIISPESILCLNLLSDVSLVTFLRALNKTAHIAFLSKLSTSFCRLRSWVFESPIERFWKGNFIWNITLHISSVLVCRSNCPCLSVCFCFCLSLSLSISLSSTTWVSKPPHSQFLTPYTSKISLVLPTVPTIQSDQQSDGRSVGRSVRRRSGRNQNS